MADIEAALYTTLTSHVGLSALLSTRAYPDLLPDNPTMPALTFQMISNVREERHRGQTGDASPRFQITVWADTRASRAAVAEQVRLAVMAMDGSVVGVEIKGVENAGETRTYEPDTKRYGTMLDFFIHHTEAVA
jgi:hypothetical protein